MAVGNVTASVTKIVMMKYFMVVRAFFFTGVFSSFDASRDFEPAEASAQNEAAIVEPTESRNREKPKPQLFEVVLRRS